MLCCPGLLTGALILPLASNLSILVLGRVLSAMSAWLAYPSANILISETVHPSLRGYLGPFTSVFLALGMWQSYLMGYILPWRTMCWVLTYQPVLLLLCLYFVKETPYWLAGQGRQEEATASLKWSRGKDWNVSEEITEILDNTPGRPPGLGERVKTASSASFLRPLSMAGSLFFLCQYTGISTLMVFMTPVFADSGLTLDPALAPAIIGAVRVVTSCCSSAALGKANRKYMFSSCSLLLSFCCAAISAFSYWREDILATSRLLGLLPLVITIIMFIAHAFGINGVMHLITGEVFPSKVRSLGSSFTLTIAMTGNAINSSLYPAILSISSFSIVFLLYSIGSLVLAVTAWMIVPDHRGLSLNRIEEEEGR